MHRVGDKVIIKHGQDKSRSRGVVEEVDGETVYVRVEGTEQILAHPSTAVRNLSSAARKAWEQMPSRRVGRPKGRRVFDRVSVTVRLNRAVWELFRKAEAAGIIRDRTLVLNTWISQGLETLLPSDWKTK